MRELLPKFTIIDENDMRIRHDQACGIITITLMINSHELIE